DWYEVGGFLAAALAPWTPLAAAALIDNLRLLFATDPTVRRRARLFSSWMIAPIALIAISKSKRPDYLVVMTPVYAVAVGVWWSDVVIDPARRVERILLILIALGASLAPLLIAEENFLILFSPSATSITATGLAIALLIIAIYLNIRSDF